MTNTTDGPARDHEAPPAPLPPGEQGPVPGARFSRRTTVVAAVAALAVAVGGGAALTGWGPGADEFQPPFSAGSNPFMAPVGTDQPGVVPVAAGGRLSGDTGGMYAENPGVPACDASVLLGNLQVDPAKAGAWGQVLGVAPDALPGFVGSLSPVLLRANTAVVDHGYRDGTFVATPAVLAAGTAVLINSYGEPTVKCFSGNPLTPGASSDPAVTTVAAAPSVIVTNVFHDAVTGAPLSRPGKPDITGSGPNPGGNGGPGGGPGGPGKLTPEQQAEVTAAEKEVAAAKDRELAAGRAADAARGALAGADAKAAAASKALKGAYDDYDSTARWVRDAEQLLDAAIREGRDRGTIAAVRAELGNRRRALEGKRQAWVTAHENNEAAKVAAGVARSESQKANASLETARRATEQRERELGELKKKIEPVRENPVELDRPLTGVDRGVVGPPLSPSIETTTPRPEVEVVEPGSEPGQAENGPTAGGTETGEAGESETGGGGSAGQAGPTGGESGGGETG